jgi:hypothetical protein
MEDCSAIIDDIHRRYRPTDSHDGHDWARRTERDLVYDIVKHNHELYLNPPPALMERLKSIVASPDQIHKNSMIFHTLAQHYRLMGGVDFCYSDKIRRDNDSVKHDNSALCPDADPGPGADVQLKPMQLKPPDHKKVFSVPVLPQGPNNRMCHVLAVCSYCIGVNFPQTLDSKLNDVKFEKVTLDDLMKLYKDVKFEKVTFAAFCMDLLMQSFRASKETMATEILDDDAEVQLRMNNKNLKYVQHSTGLLVDNGLDSVLVNYAFQGGAQCDEHATNFDEQHHRDPKHDSALNGGDALSNLTNILVIHGHTCVSSSTETGQVTIRKSIFSKGMAILDVTGADMDSVLERGKSLGIKYGVLSIPEHVVCAVHDGLDWYVCDQTYQVMMKVAEFRQRSIYMKKRGEFSLSAFCNESIDEKPTEYFNICSAADGNCFFNSIYLAARSMNIPNIPKPEGLRSKFMSAIEDPSDALKGGIVEHVNFESTNVGDLVDVFIATHAAYDDDEGAYKGAFDHTYNTRMTDDDRTKKMGELVKLHKTPYTYTPYLFERLWNAMADLHPLFEGMPKLHVINSQNGMAQSFPLGHKLLKNSESGPCMWLKHTNTGSHYEPFVCRHPREFVSDDDLRFFNSSMATPTTYVNIAMKYTEELGSIVLHEHDYVGVIIREESKKKCNDWLPNVSDLSGGARRMSLWPAVALAAWTLLMAAAQ